MEVEPWEALDLDDSDLPSLLRPCKRRRSASPTTTAAAASPTTTAAAACANPLPQSASTPSPEQHCHEQLPRQPPDSASRRRTIPGPAGAVLSAMLRKDLDRENRNGEDFGGNNGCDGVITTQDYIRRAMEDTADFDDDFSRQPWISALQFLGAKDGVVKCTPISSIKNCMNGGKVVQVVAVIKSCTPNGLGGLIVSLKDPTGSVGASVHHKVLSGSEFGKNLTIGSVLILQEVAIFAPARSTHYLNITLRNLLKVFYQTSASTSKLNDSAYLPQYADSGVENCGNSKTIENISTMQNVTMEEDMEKRQRLRMTQNLHCSVIQRENLFDISAQSIDRASTNVTAARNGFINLSQDSGETCATGVNSKVSLNETNNLNESVTKSSGQELQETNAVQLQNQRPKSKVSLANWTDDQLEQLFAGDVDDGSLF